MKQLLEKLLIEPTKEATWKQRKHHALLSIGAQTALFEEADQDRAGLEKAMRLFFCSPHDANCARCGICGLS